MPIKSLKAFGIAVNRTKAMTENKTAKIDTFLEF
jgi:hypothetical protein